MQNSGALRRGNADVYLNVIARSVSDEAIHSFFLVAQWIASVALAMMDTAFRLDCTGNATDIPRSRRYINPPGTSGLLALEFGIRKMTGTTRSSGGLDDRRKRLLFRCWHRGTREMDLILGRFADAEIAHLTGDELDQLERLIEVPDPDLYAALTGGPPLAPQHAGGLFDRIKSFRPGDHGA